MRNKFEGLYFKHQKADKVVALIPGRSEEGAFLQIITDLKSGQYHFPDCEMTERQGKLTVGGCEFSDQGIRIALPGITGSIRYDAITPIRSDIMGIFRFFPMECRHSIISMRHTLHGGMQIGDVYYDFEGGTGYIEGDSGTSFPEKYIWMQANDFNTTDSFMLSLAKIPFCGMHFEGCICVLLVKGREYRFATYYGARARVSGNEILLTQGRLRLRICLLSAGTAYPLSFPSYGKMQGIIREQNDAQFSVELFAGKERICRFKSRRGGYENHGYGMLVSADKT